MPAPRNRRHLVVPGEPAQEAYTPHGRKISPRSFPRPEDRREHAAFLRRALLQVQAETEERREDVQILVHGAQPGIYVQFQSPPEVDLKLESLEDRRRGIELLAVQAVKQVDEGDIQLATVFVPQGKLGHFLKRVEEYAEKDTKKGEPRHRDLIERIARLRRASLRALWTDDPALYPDEDQQTWWEIWLRRDGGNELERFMEFAGQAEIVIGERKLAFEDRTVVLAWGSASQLSQSLDVLNDLAELRRTKEGATFFVEARPEEQAEWAENLRERARRPEPDAPAVCVLDTGVTRGHPLLRDLLEAADATAVDPAWGSHDDGGGPGNAGHGTSMAGLAAYGDLAEALLDTGPIVLRHRLESVKILPPTGQNPRELYGAITAEAVARPEIQAPARPRVFALAVTTDGLDRGQPTSWSAAIDALAAGRSFDTAPEGLVYLDDAEPGVRRLFVVSAGNVQGELDRAHLDRSDVESVHDPAQAWNVLTVGGCTNKAVITDPDLREWIPVAAPGDLSPWSTTSLLFDPSWPVKPDVVFEGGNAAYNGAEVDFPIADLSLLTTYHRPAEKLFDLSCGTSAASAQVARIAAMIRSEYPALWPETVRALVVHSARWTPRMWEALRGVEGKRARGRLVRRYGFGVPDAERASRSADDALTLIAQATIRPFASGRMREMHLHSLPWPRGVLAEMGPTEVRLRVTLSYFIEPNPGRRGWKRRHRYASHGLRFAVKTPTESLDEFRKALNRKALEEEEEKPRRTGGDSEEWFLDEQTRNTGSIHSDVWTGTAVDLAERGFIGIYPVSGWWKELPRRDRSEFGARYSLVLSIETEAEDVDIWTPVAQQIGVLVQIQV